MEARLADQRLFADEKESLAAQIAAHKRAVALADENTLMARATGRRCRWRCATGVVVVPAGVGQAAAAADAAGDERGDGDALRAAAGNSLSAPPPTAAADAKAAAVKALLSTRITRTRERTTAPARRRGSAPAIAAADATMVGAPRALAASAPCRTVVHCGGGVAPCRAAVQRGSCRSLARQGTLKSEIVQLERAHKRDSVDMEYLKNVVLKYMTRPWTRGEWDREYGVSAQRRGYHQRR
jgi:hypothetical protein